MLFRLSDCPFGCVSLLLSFSVFKGSWDYIGRRQIIWDNLSILRSTY